jgi:hypothetical protein
MPGFNGMGDVQLMFLQYAGKTPSLASCSKCHLKFFTPQELLKQPEAAAQYLRDKFSVHTCQGEIPEETRAGTVQIRRLRIIRLTYDSSPLGICEACNMRFLAPVYFRGHAEQAEVDIRLRFGQHKCKRWEAG